MGLLWTSYGICILSISLQNSTTVTKALAQALMWAPPKAVGAAIANSCIRGGAQSQAYAKAVALAISTVGCTGAIEEACEYCWRF